MSVLNNVYAYTLKYHLQDMCTCIYQHKHIFFAMSFVLIVTNFFNVDISCCNPFNKLSDYHISLTNVLRTHTYKNTNVSWHWCTYTILVLYTLSVLRCNCIHYQRRLRCKWSAFCKTFAPTVKRNMHEQCRWKKHTPDYTTNTQKKQS